MKKIVFTVFLFNVSNRIVDTIKEFNHKKEKIESAEEIKESIPSGLKSPIVDSVKSILDVASVVEKNNDSARKMIIKDMESYIVTHIIARDYMGIEFQDMHLEDIYYDGHFAYFTFQ